MKSIAIALLFSMLPKAVSALEKVFDTEKIQFGNAQALFPQTRAKN